MNVKIIKRIDYMEYGIILKLGLTKKQRKEMLMTTERKLTKDDLFEINYNTLKKACELLHEENELCYYKIDGPTLQSRKLRLKDYINNYEGVFPDEDEIGSIMFRFGLKNIIFQHNIYCSKKNRDKIEELMRYAKDTYNIDIYVRYLNFDI